MNNNIYIKEIFSSIQGEGLYIGERQLFLRFCGCNLNCAYCDTNFQKEETFPIYNLNKFHINPISPDDLVKVVNQFPLQTISLTGGEPLLFVDFLKEFLHKVENRKIYLETNGTLYKELNEIINLVDIVSMDIKLSCSTKEPNQFENNQKFIQIAKDANKEIFAKIILDKNYSKEELLSAINITKNFDIPLIIQPMDCKDKSNSLNKESMLDLMDFILEKYCNARLIPQTHKYLDLL